MEEETPGSVTQRRPGGPAFVAAIALGSFLLFLVQPMIAKMALPRLGGTPAVWNSAMLVYQTLLLAGYAYAHGLGRLAPRWQIAIHAGMFLAASAWLPIGLAGREPPPGGDPVLWAPLFIATSIGPLFLVVASQAPLLQRWHAMGGSDPYPLYAASNLGSLAGLLAYPLLLEPFVGLGSQRMVWSVGYVILAVATLTAFATMRRGPKPAASQTTPPPTAARYAWWVLLAAVPSGLMLSTTTYLTTDIVATPLLWVLPLAAYLLTFVVAFSGRNSLIHVIERGVPLLLLISSIITLSPNGRIPLLSVPLSIATLFAVGVALHGAMHRSRPAADHLTGFYLAMSLGGVVGGVACALVAPALFDWVWEHPLLLIAAALLVPHRPLILDRAMDIRVAIAIAILMTMLIGGGIHYGRQVAIPGLVITTFVGFAAVCLVGSRWSTTVCMAAFMVFQGSFTRIAGEAIDARFRSYFGSYRIIETGDVRLIYSGTTIHGMQRIRPKPSTERLSYYSETSGVSRGVTAARPMYSAPPRIGVIGLGAGTLACLAQPREAWSFYEIDPDVVRVARDPRYFTYLRDCAPNSPIIVGDARLTMQREADLSKDILILDAFSSDAIPTHLLTREAFAQYDRLTGPRGLMLVHISNQHVDLEPLMAAMRDRHPAVLVDTPDARHHGMSVWVALTRDADIAKAIRNADERWREPRSGREVRPWTDASASILPLLHF